MASGSSGRVASAAILRRIKARVRADGSLSLADASIKAAGSIHRLGAEVGLRHGAGIGPELLFEQFPDPALMPAQVRGDRPACAPPPESVSRPTFSPAFLPG